MKKKKELETISPISAVLASVLKGVKDGQVLTSDMMDTAALRYQSSGLVELDEIINKGKGFPKAKFVEVAGMEGSGKTHLLFHFARQCQARKKITVLIDVENRYSTDYIFNEIGLDKQLTIIIKPLSANEVLENMFDYINNPDVGMIGVDSIASLLTEQELMGEISDANIGAQARLVTRWSSRGSKRQTNVNAPTIFCTNQLRDDIGAMYGSKIKLPGGKAYHHILCVRLFLSVCEKIVEKGIRIGHEVKIKITKNSVGMNDGECKAPLYYGHGFSNHESFEKKIPKKGSRYIFQLNEKDYNMSQSDLFKWLKEEPRKSLALWEKLNGREKLKVKKDSSVVTVAPSTEQSLESQETPSILILSEDLDTQ